MPFTRSMTLNNRASNTPSGGVPALLPCARPCRDVPCAEAAAARLDSLLERPRAIRRSSAVPYWEIGPGGLTTVVLLRTADRAT